MTSGRSARSWRGGLTNLVKGALEGSVLGGVVFIGLINAGLSKGRSNSLVLN
jgi:hypothetical protein